MVVSLGLGLALRVLCGTCVCVRTRACACCSSKEASSGVRRRSGGGAAIAAAEQRTRGGGGARTELGRTTYFLGVVVLTCFVCGWCAKATALSFGPQTLQLHTNRSIKTHTP